MSEKELQNSDLSTGPRQLAPKLLETEQAAPDHGSLRQASTEQLSLRQASTEQLSPRQASADHGCPTQPGPALARPASVRDRLGIFFRRVPLSFFMAALFLLTALLCGTWTGQASDAVLNQWGMSGMALTQGHWWAPLSGILIPQGPYGAATSVLGSIVFLGIAENILGTRRAFLALLLTGLAGSLAGVLLQWLGTLTWQWWTNGTSTVITLDPLTGVFGALSVASAGMTPLWRRRVRVVLLTFVLIFLLYSGDAQDLFRLLAVLIGLPLGLLLSPRHEMLPARFSSHRETRTLVAAVLLVTALGPVIAFIGSTDVTPFAFGSYLFMNDSSVADAVSAYCAEPSHLSRQCLHLLARLGSAGPGMYLLSFVPVLLLGVAAWGLFRGRRFAWWLGLGVNLAILVFAPRAFSSVRFMAHDAGQLRRPFDPQELTIWLLTAAVVPLVSIILLLLTRKRFGIAGPRGSAKVMALTLFSAFAVLAGGYIGLMSSGKGPRPGLGTLFLDTPGRFVPPHFHFTKSGMGLPANTFPAWTAQWIGVAFWAVALVTFIWYLSQPASSTKDAAAARDYRALLQRHGGGTLGHMGTWPGNTPWFTPEREGALAYRVVNGFALVLGDPVAARGRKEEVIAGFLQFCDRYDLKPVFYSIHPETASILEAMGWNLMNVGEETLIHTGDFAMKGKAWQSVRTALNKATREGMTTVWTSWRELTFPAINEIMAISETWVAESDLPEMGFTLGGVEELHDSQVRLMLALDAQSRIQAVTSWLPVYEDGEVIGWTLDFMRRAADSPNGVMEFLIASAALHMKAQGYRVLSLSGAPLATKPVSDPQAREPGTMDQVLAWLARTLEPAYGFSSLFRFKSKFHPEYVTLSMAYPDALHLPGIAVALGRAYLPGVQARQAMGFMRSLGRKKQQSPV